MRFIFDAAVAVIGYIFVDTVTKERTGKHIHEHVFQWWCEMHDYLNRWLLANTHLGICQVGVAILDNIDNVAVRTKQLADRVTLQVIAHSKYKTNYAVTSKEVSRQEALKQFPELANTPEVLIQELSA
jgi:hypothetical protein